MKKILAVIFLISSFAHAQYTINGTMTPPHKDDWVILYKIEGTKQIFVQNTSIKIDSIANDHKRQAIGSFKFTLPVDAKSGFYRATYKLKEAGFVDFIFNKENISFAFHPEYPEQSVVFSESKENILYRKSLDSIASAQYQLDSIQVAKLQNPSLDLKEAYTKSLEKLIKTSKYFLESAKNSYSFPFLEASLQNNPSTILVSPEKYLATIKDTFFSNINFSNQSLLNSSFLVDKITEYIFYINHSNDANTQEELYKKAIEIALSKITSLPFKKDIIEFLVVQFETSKNLEIIDYLFENHYNNLPISLQNEKFKKQKLMILATEVGRIAPDFSWKENGKTFWLSNLKSAEHYVLVFWSTECSHCIREIPQLHTFLKENSNVKVVAFSLEKEAFTWKSYQTNLYGWHHVLGLNKWENKIARTYNIHATPSYFILDANKKIIAKPKKLENVKQFFGK